MRPSQLTTITSTWGDGGLSIERETSHTDRLIIPSEYFEREIRKVLENFIEKIASLEKELNSIKSERKKFVTEDVIIKEWDNEYDERWNTM